MKVRDSNIYSTNFIKICFCTFWCINILESIFYVEKFLKSNFKENVGVHELPEKKVVREKPHLGKKLKFNFDLFLPVFTSQ